MQHLDALLLNGLTETNSQFPAMVINSISIFLGVDQYVSASNLIYFKSLKIFLFIHEFLFGNIRLLDCLVLVLICFVHRIY